MSPVYPDAVVPNHYVLVYAAPQELPDFPYVLVINKLRPMWQRGRLNLPGGHIEKGEAIHTAACRELHEETNIECPEENAHLLGSIEGDDFVCYVVRCNFPDWRTTGESVTSEQIDWMPLHEVLRDERLIDNLRLIIPLARSSVNGWIIRENNGELLVSIEHENA